MKNFPLIIVIGNPDSESFCHALAGVIEKGAQEEHIPVCVHDLYRDRFDPVLNRADISRKGPADDLTARYCGELSGAGSVVIIHPDWWGMPPAIVKGWIDRILCAGVGFAWESTDSGSAVFTPLLTSIAAQVIITTDRTDTTQLEPLRALWTKEILGYCGMNPVHVEIMSGLRQSTLSQRVRYLERGAALGREVIAAACGQGS